MAATSPRTPCTRGGAGRFFDRYTKKSSSAFDKLISATHDHFWDPLNRKYIDFSEPFDAVNEALMPEEMFPVLRCAYVQNALLEPKQKIRFINESTRWSLSSILRGE